MIAPERQSPGPSPKNTNIKSQEEEELVKGVEKDGQGG